MSFGWWLYSEGSTQIWTSCWGWKFVPMDADGSYGQSSSLLSHHPIPYQSSPCTFSAFVFFKTLGSLLLQRSINSSSVSRRNITVVFCECVSNMSCNRTAQDCRGLEAVAHWGPWYIVTLKACCSSWVTFTLHQWGMWWENTSIHYKKSKFRYHKEKKICKILPFIY